MRGAWCVVRVIIVCAVLSACSDQTVLPAVQPSSTALVTTPPLPTLVSVRTTVEPMGTVCSGEAEPPTIAPGWKLLWQKVFDQPIARPPVVDAGQMLLIERTDARPKTLQDSIIAVDPQTGDIQWNFIEAKAPVPHVARNVLNIQYSPKYWLLLLWYLNPEGSPNIPSMKYEIIVDRQSGKVVYDSGPNATGWATTVAISDEALYDHYSNSAGVFAYEYMRRIDLSFGPVRWMQVWGARGSRGLSATNGSLYVFADNIERYDLSDGHLTASTKFDVYPGPGDLAFETNLAIMRSERSLGVFDLQSFSGVWHTPVGERPGRGSNAFWGDIPSLSVTSDSIYLFDAKNTLSRFDLRTGKQIWHTPSPGPQAMSRPIAMNNMVYGLFADGTVRAFAESDGTLVGMVAQSSIWYRESAEEAREFLDLVGGLGVSGDTLIVTTGCRSVYAIQRAP